jgi:hypothetical protein
MTARTALRTAIVAQCGFLLAGTILSFLLPRLLPEPLRTWQSQWLEADPSGMELVSVATVIPTLVAALVASIALFLLKPWGRWLYLASLIVMFLCGAFGGPMVSHGLVDTLVGLSNLLSGVVLGLAFFSDALQRSAEQDAAPDAETAAQEIPTPKTPTKHKLLKSVAKDSAGVALLLAMVGALQGFRRGGLVGGIQFSLGHAVAGALIGAAVGVTLRSVPGGVRAAMIGCTLGILVGGLGNLALGLTGCIPYEHVMYSVYLGLGIGAVLGALAGVLLQRTIRRMRQAKSEPQEEDSDV